MSNPAPLPYPPRQPTNTLAVIGFVLSILGFLTGLVLCPIGFILCFFAMFKRPRGLAVVGMFIGFIGTAILAAILFVFGFVIFTCFTLGTPGFRTVVAVAEARQAINNYVIAHGTLPNDLEGQLAISSETDGWGHILKYTREGQRFEIRSAGPDGFFNTGDDIEQVYP